MPERSDSRAWSRPKPVRFALPVRLQAEHGEQQGNAADQADTNEVYQAMLGGGLALAWTAVDAAKEPAFNTYLLESAASRKVAEGLSPSGQRSR